MGAKLKRSIIFILLLTVFSIRGQSLRSDTNHLNKIPPQYNLGFSYKIHYPELAEKKKIEGTVILSFDIDSTCSVINRKIVKSIGYGCDEEALKVLDQSEIYLKQTYKLQCAPAKDMRLPVKFSLVINR